MDFHVMGFIWKPTISIMIGEVFMILTTLITENWEQRENVSGRVLCTKTLNVLNKNGLDTFNLSLDFSAAEHIQVMKTLPIKVEIISFHLSPITWKSIKDLRSCRPPKFLLWSVLLKQSVQHFRPLCTY